MVIAALPVLGQALTKTLLGSVSGAWGQPESPDRRPLP